MVGDHFQDRWRDKLKWPPFVPPTGPSVQPISPSIVDYVSVIPSIQISKQEFDDLKKEVELLKGLLKKAKIYDEENNEPECELDSKIQFLKQVAEWVGVDLEEVFPRS